MAVGEVERRVAGRSGERDSGHVLARPGDGLGVGVHAVPFDLRVRGGQRAQGPARRAAEVEAAAHVAEVAAGDGERLRDQVGRVVVAAGRERAAAHRVDFGRRLVGRQAGALEHRGDAVVDAEREREVDPVRRRRPVPQRGELAVERGLDGFEVLGAQAVEQAPRDRLRADLGDGHVARGPVAWLGRVGRALASECPYAFREAHR